jgi:hypothetical protein
MALQTLASEVGLIPLNSSVYFCNIHDILKTRTFVIEVQLRYTGSSEADRRVLITGQMQRATENYWKGHLLKASGGNESGRGGEKENWLPQSEYREEKGPVLIPIHETR